MLSRALLGSLAGSVLLLLGGGAARAETRVYIPPPCAAPLGRPDPETLLACHAPVFVAPRAERSYNRIGSPRIERARFGRTRVRVDPEVPALYAEVRGDDLAGRPVLQLVYRVHFEKIPLRLSRYFFEAHRNVGLLTIVTLDAQSLEPYIVTSVHTCGCYRAVVPTDRFPLSALPEGWPEELKVYGQRLPATLAAPSPGRARLVVTLRADNHRVVDLRVDPALPSGAPVEIPIVPMERLRSMPVIGGPDGARGSIFHTAGLLKGHVRGAWNPFEALNVFGLVSLDPTVGMDKDFGDPAKTGTPFYTMLRFWKHDTSRLDRLDVLLSELGFSLDALAGGGE